MSVSPEGGPWGNGDGRLLYPPRREPSDDALVAGPVDSIRFASLRDGLEDREYLWLLARKAEKDPGAKAALDRARWTLVKSMTCYEQNPLVFLAERERVAAALESVQ